jgi:hypothetical protein
VSIKQVILLHNVNGKLVSTGSLKVGETGTLVIMYATAHAGSLKPGGSIVLREKGQLVKSGTLKATTYGGKAALSATIRLTSASRVGTLKVQVQVFIGSIVAAATHTFTLRPKV